MFDNAVNPVINLLENMLNPLILLVSAVGAIYCVIIGAKFAKAEEPQDREKAKQALKNAIIGFLLIFILLVVLKGLTPQMIKWVNSNYKGTI